MYAHASNKAGHERDRKMKIHKRFVDGLVITVYNDSNIEWVVDSEEQGKMRFNRNHFTMSEAIELYARIYS